MPRRTGPARLLLVAALVVGGVAVALAQPAIAAPPAGDDLRVVNYNILHGTFCDDGAHCRVSDRVDLFLDQLESGGCPQVVGLQEVSDEIRGLVVDRAAGVCNGTYDVVFADTKGNDTELVLTSLKARQPSVHQLPGGLRRASRVELDSPVGPVVLVVTHQDGDKTFPSCRNDIERYQCPKPCPEGATFSACQTILAERLATKGGPKGALRIYMGDFNVPAGSPRHTALLADGWVDSHLAAGNAECDPATGIQCTSGRNDVTLAALEDPTARESERIDFIFVKAPKLCTPKFDAGADGDGDGVGTGLFAATPAVGGPGGLVWPSDHTAVSMDLTCA
jgi:endonuclease/exonuclease/phosphatase family metal-dependent hydrolase